MKKIVEFVYGIVKSYMMKQAVDTGNNDFVIRMTNAFHLIEQVYVEVNYHVLKQRGFK